MIAFYRLSELIIALQSVPQRTGFTVNCASGLWSLRTFHDARACACDGTAAMGAHEQENDCRMRCAQQQWPQAKKPLNQPHKT